MKINKLKLLLHRPEKPPPPAEPGGVGGGGGGGGGGERGDSDTFPSLYDWVNVLENSGILVTLLTSLTRRHACRDGTPSMKRGGGGNSDTFFPSSNFRANFPDMW